MTYRENVGHGLERIDPYDGPRSVAFLRRRRRRDWVRRTHRQRRMVLAATLLAAGALLGLLPGLP